MEGALSGVAALVVVLAHGTGLFGGAKGVGDEEGPIGGDADGAGAEGIEMDFEGAALLAGEGDGVVHASAAGADVLFAVGEDFHEFFEGGLDLVGFEQGEGEGDEEGGGRGESGGGGDVACDFGVDAVVDTPAEGYGLGGGFEVVAPIAGFVWRDGLRPFEFTRREAVLADGVDLRACGVGEMHGDALADGHGEHG